MPKRWLIREHDPAQIVRLEREAGVSAVVAQLLIGRGITDPLVARTFLTRSSMACAIRTNCRACQPPPID